MSEDNFFSLEIRDLDFEYDKYYLSLEDRNKYTDIFIDNNKNNEENEELLEDAISNITPYTVIPKFLIDKISSPLLYQIINIDYYIMNKEKQRTKEKEKEKEENDKENLEVIKEFKINVKSYTTKEIICSFNVKYPLFSDFYKFLGKSTIDFKIQQFPCILLQSKDGYFMLSQSNKDLEDEIILVNNQEEENKSIIRQNPLPEKKSRTIDLEKIMQLKGTYDSIISEINKKKIELIDKKKGLKTLIEERKIIYEEKYKILSSKKNLEITKNSWTRLITLKELLTNINAFTSEIIVIKEKKIAECNTEIEKYKKELNMKKNKDIPYLQKINKEVYITNYLLYKYALSELCNFFFNKNINKFNAFPSFYKIPLNDLKLDKKMVENFYNKYNKEVSALFGNIVLLLIYLSKKFDIILPYALYYNGSKSMVFINMEGNNSVDLYLKDNDKNILAYGTKNENEIQMKIEILSKMIYDVIMFFYSKKINSDKVSVENILEKKKKNNLYLNFMKLNELFKDILSSQDK